MYNHIVFLKLKGNEEEKENLSRIVKDKLDTLPNLITEIIKYETAVNIGDYGASFYDVSLISTFKYEVDFWKYTKYQVNYDVVDFIKTVQDSEHIVDYII